MRQISNHGKTYHFLELLAHMVPQESRKVQRVRSDGSQPTSLILEHLHCARIAGQHWMQHFQRHQSAPQSRVVGQVDHAKRAVAQLLLDSVSISETIADKTRVEK